MPTVPTAGVPLSNPAVVNVTPVGNAPVSLKAGAGNPVAVTVNVPALPTVKVVFAALVIAGAVPLIVRVKLCVALGNTPLLAVIVIEYAPAVPAAGVPLNTPPVVNVTPDGNDPVSLKVGVGDPFAVTVNVPAPPTVKAVLLALVIAGAWLTVSVNVCVALGNTPLPAVMVIV